MILDAYKTAARPDGCIQNCPMCVNCGENISTEFDGDVYYCKASNSWRQQNGAIVLSEGLNTPNAKRAGLGFPPVVDMVNHPPHYTQGGVECLDAIRAMTGDGYEGFLRGSILKYLWRYPMKNGVEDLKKARFYLDRLISEVEKGGGEDE